MLQWPSPYESCPTCFSTPFRISFLPLHTFVKVFAISPAPLLSIFKRSQATGIHFCKVRERCDRIPYAELRRRGDQHANQSTPHLGRCCQWPFPDSISASLCMRSALHGAVLVLSGKPHVPQPKCLQDSHRLAGQLLHIAPPLHRCSTLLQLHPPHPKEQDTNNHEM